MKSCDGCKHQRKLMGYFVCSGEKDAGMAFVGIAGEESGLVTVKFLPMCRDKNKGECVDFSEKVE